MAIKLVTARVSLTPRDLQAALLGLLLTASHAGIEEIPFTRALESLRGDIDDTERMIVSEDELTEAARELQRKHLAIYQRGVLRLPG